MSDFNSSLPIRTENAGDVIVKLGDGTTPSQQLAIDSSGRISTMIRDATGNALTSQVSGSQRALDVGINVAGVQVDPRAIRALTSSDVVTARLNDATGAAFSISNPLPVSISDTVAGATEILDFKQASAIAAGSTDTHNYTVTSAKTLKLQKVSATGSGKIKVEILIGTTGSETLKVVLFNSTSNPNVEYSFGSPQSLADTKSVKVTITNLDKSAMDLYSTIEGYEV